MELHFLIQPNNFVAFETVIESRASRCIVVHMWMFPDPGKGYPEMQTHYPAAKFTGHVDICLGMQESGIDDIIHTGAKAASNPLLLKYLSIYMT